jgi:pyridoxine/pyridoxamine 5'-phosphate oxidase
MSDNKDSNNLYIEQRAKGDFAVRKPKTKRASAIAPTQAEAIERAKKLNPNAAIHVERVRDTNVGNPDQWWQS